MAEQTTDELIDALRSLDWDTQLAAAEQLAQMGAAAVEPLIKLMREYPTSEVFYSEADNLHHLAENTLIQIGEPAVEPLIRAVSENNFGARVGAILCLGDMREIRAVQPLIEALWREDGTTFLDIDGALEKIGDIAVRPLIHALENPNAVIRRHAAAILGHFNDHAAVPALIEVLGDESVEVQSSVAHALGSIADARAVEPLIAALEDYDPAVREAMVRALGQIGSKLNSPRIIETLVMAIHDDDWGTRQSAAEMLIRLDGAQSEEARALLLDDLQSDDDEVRLGAAWSLANVEDRMAFDVLLGLVDHENAGISGGAASALGDYGDKRAIPALIKLLSHGDVYVTLVAQTALRKLGHDAGE